MKMILLSKMLKYGLQKSLSHVSFEETKRKGIEKLFLYKYDDFFIVIGWLLQGRKNRNTVIYNKAFTEFLMEIKSIYLKTPEGFDKKRNNKVNNKNDNTEKGNKYRQNGNYGLKYNPNPDGDNFVNPFKNSPKPKPKDKNKLYVDNTPYIDKIKIILEKINRSGLDSLSIEEMTFLKNNSGNV